MPAVTLHIRAGMRGLCGNLCTDAHNYTHSEDKHYFAIGDEKPTCQKCITLATPESTPQTE